MESMQAPTVNQLHHACRSYSPLDTSWKETTKRRGGSWRNTIRLHTARKETGFKLTDKHIFEDHLIPNAK